MASSGPREQCFKNIIQSVPLRHERSWYRVTPENSCGTSKPSETSGDVFIITINRLSPLSFLSYNIYLPFTMQGTDLSSLQ